MDFSGSVIFQQLTKKTPVFGAPLLWYLFGGSSEGQAASATAC